MLSDEACPVSLRKFPSKFAVALDGKVYDARSLTRVSKVPHSRRSLGFFERHAIKKLAKQKDVESWPLPHLQAGDIESLDGPGDA